ncbi:hypothetical protein TWF481_007437 [Arthrobotrys musiformis]|uniref:DUF4219 domain-containing protein n=1 Tax=Arthrobotrys musiformis TaxID=47236 RepID=A0AAV9WBQ3_9PEZI
MVPHGSPHRYQPNSYHDTISRGGNQPNRPQEPPQASANIAASPGVPAHDLLTATIGKFAIQPQAQGDRGSIPSAVSGYDTIRSRQHVPAAGDRGLMLPISQPALPGSNFVPQTPFLSPRSLPLSLLLTPPPPPPPPRPPPGFEHRVPRPPQPFAPPAPQPPPLMGPPILQPQSRPEYVVSPGKLRFAPPKLPYTTGTGVEAADTLFRISSLHVYLVQLREEQRMVEGNIRTLCASIGANVSDFGIGGGSVNTSPGGDTNPSSDGVPFRVLLDSDNYDTWKIFIRRKIEQKGWLDLIGGRTRSQSSREGSEDFENFCAPGTTEVGDDDASTRVRRQIDCTMFILEHVRVGYWELFNPYQRDPRVMLQEIEQRWEPVAKGGHGSGEYFMA